MSVTQMGLLERLANVATLGTRRAPLPKDSLWPDGSLAGADAAAGAERQLLRAAAAAALWERAGARATVYADVAPDFPARAALLDDSAGWRVARIVSGEHVALLREWFELAAATGRTLAPHWLPMLLERVPPRERNEFAAVLGPAAPWLAARNPRWQALAVIEEPSEQRWQEGTLDERRAELGALRNLDPDRARGWIRATWETDPPEAREAFLLALVPTLSSDDEALLESALDDKRKAVRQAAAECLARLPVSAHAQRNLARIAPMFQLAAESGGLLGKLRRRKLKVELPTAPDKAAQRDGIEVKPPASRKIGERAFWLLQMTALVPPAHWCRHFGCDAATLCAAALETDYANELREAFTAAIVRHPEAEWIRELTRAWLESKQDFQQIAAALVALTGAAAPADRLALLEALLRESSQDNFDLASQVLASVDMRWNASLTQVAFDRLAAVIGASTANFRQPRDSLDSWARRCDLVVGPARAAALLGKFGEGHSWRNALEQFNDIVAFRATMQQEINR